MRRAVIAGIVFAALFGVTLTAFAQTGGDFDLSWSSIDGGGGGSLGGEFFVVGSIGQADAGVELIGGGGEFSLIGGFQAGTTAIAPSEVCGDQNNDFKVTADDVFLDLKFIVGILIPKPFQSFLSDLDGDGAIGITDVVKSLKNIVAGSPEIENCGV